MNVVEQLKADESLRLTAYDDGNGKPLRPGSICAGHPTIGYGRCLDTNGISREEAEYLLHNDIIRAAEQVEKSLPWTTQINEPRRAVLVAMAFNMGIGGLLSFNRMLEAAEAGRYDDASDAMLRSKWALQVKDRAVRLASQLRSGQWPQT